MKVASKLVFLFRDPDGFGAAIYNALQPSPNSSFQKSESNFELSLEQYGIGDHTARGDITHFVDGDGQFEVSVFLMQYYEPPILACAVNEVLASIASESSVTLVLPFVLSASKLKFEDKLSSGGNKSLIYGQQIGPENEFVRDIVSKGEKLPSSQVHYEPMGCLIHFVRVLKISTALLVGIRDLRPSGGSRNHDLEVLCEIGKILASSLPLHFKGDGIKLNVRETAARDLEKEPWRALYG